MEQVATKKKSPMLLIILAVAALVVVGGSASAFFILNKSPKVQYFLAESKTVEEMKTLFDDRYKNEVNWSKVQREKPVETTYDLSAEWNDPAADYEMQEIQSIINSVALSMKQVKDPVKKELEFELGGEFGSVSTKLVTLFGTPEKVLFTFPFMDDYIQFNDADFGKLMKEADEDYDGDEKLGLSYLFDDNFLAAEELRTYIGTEYVEYIVKEIPEDAFSSEKEELDIFGQKKKTTKVVMDLSEKQVKTLYKKIFEKAKDDEKLKEAIKEQIAFRTFGEEVSSLAVKDTMEEFDDLLAEAIDGVDAASIPNGVQSTIWHDSNIIVKREFTFSAGDEKDDVETLTVEGTQLLEKTNQKWDYTFTFEDSYGDEEILKTEGDLTWKDQKSDDTISLTMDDTKFIYKGKEALKGKKRTFTRSFGFTDGDIDPAVIWSGTATHEKDSVKANHEFTISEESIGENMFNLILKQQGKVVKKVEMPKETEDTVNLGDMDIDEIMKYYEINFMPKFEGWMYGVMGEIQGELSDL